MASQAVTIIPRIINGYRIRKLREWYYNTFYNEPKPYVVRYNEITGPYWLVMRLADGRGMRKRLRDGTELPERCLFLPLIQRGWTCCDVGAHVGDYAIEMAMLTGETGSVFAFEAIPHYFELLQKSIQINRLSNVVARLAAVGSTERTIEVPREMLTGNLVRPGRIRVTSPDAEIPTVMVPVVRLDDEMEQCDAAKIDCEGYEVEVLKGMHRLISENPNLLLFLEVHQRQLADVGNSLAELGELLLKEHCLRVRRISRKHCICSGADLPLDPYPLLTSVDEFESAFLGT